MYHGKSERPRLWLGALAYLHPLQCDSECYASSAGTITGTLKVKVAP